MGTCHVSWDLRCDSRRTTTESGIEETSELIARLDRCDVGRRGFLRVGAGGALGLTLPQFLALRARAGDGFGQARSCIVLFAWGGISHLDTFDLKPGAAREIRGEFRPIPTSVPGIQVGEHLPRLARRMHQVALVRSVHHNAPSHRSGAYWNLTGHAPRNPGANWPATRKDWPSLGAMVSKALDDRADPRARNGAFPAAACLPYRIEDGGVANGQDGGFLGLRYDPAILRPPGGTMYPGKSPASTHLDLALPDGVVDERARERRSLLERLEAPPVVGSGPDTAGLVQAREDAMDMLLSPEVAEAFDIDREPARLRESYGDHICGRSTLLARRLTEAGVPIVTVYCAAGDLNGSVGAHFDTHADNFNRLKRDMLPPLDQASAALLDDLRERGRLDDTLVCWFTEFGRTPKINKGAGRDHFPNCYSVAFAGGGVRGGQVHGASNATGHEPADAPCGPPDLHATVFHALGIDPETRILAADGRPLALCDGRPLPVF